ncbi:D-2-hydroxyglutarate dehydrogenase, mitochondrial-like [Clytia hemisphaerica]|uniref:D-2-hydroxyglutarate dehydrogenase, mitochondrial n=1 Tax=Clytia hemisphaerica TaxID=252671 RepID=A0A7M5U107_9CNID|eukprot:TCONS_00024601-protein
MLYSRGLKRLITSLNKNKGYLSVGVRCSSVDYTYKNYNVPRRDNLKKVEESDINYFKSFLGDRVVTDVDELEVHNRDWLNLVRGMSPVMLKPKTTQEVSQIMKYCNENSLGVCPQGGNTGLVGGSVPVFDEVILSLNLLNKIHEIDATSGTVECGAGVILENLDKELEKHDLMVPLDLGAKGSCHIGGNVATNAGGIRYLRYGSLHGNVLGVEAVLPDGTILDCLSTLKKDNTGYDLKQLFIGSEGTLGIITGLSLMAPPRPLATNVAFLGVESYEAVKEAYVKAKGCLAEILSAFEFLDNHAMSTVKENLGYSNPISEHPFYVLVETSGSNDGHDAEKLDHFLEVVMETGIAVDGTVANEVGKMQDIWKMREHIAEALLHDGDGCFKYDISLPVDVMYDIVSLLREKYSHCTNRIVGYGHFGDGNLHLNVVAPTYDKELMYELEPIIFGFTSKHNGSISAEHGIGFKKTKHMHYSRSPEAIEVMKKLKNLFDPKGILNPYKMLPS